MPETKPTLNTPIARLPRAMARGTHVWETHRDTDPSLDAHGAAMVEAGGRFNLGHQTLVLREGQLADARVLLADAIGGLQRAKRGCLAEASLNLADFDTSGFTQSEVTEDVIAESQLLHGRVEARLREGEETPHVTRHLESLAAAIARAEEAAAAFYAADSAAQQARDERYAAAVVLDDRLIAFRRVVRSVLGSTHRDYRRLRARAERGGYDDDFELDEPEVEGEAEPVTDEPSSADGGL